MDINKKLQNQETTELFEAILELGNVEECYAFFIDVCTVSELQAMAQRLQVAKMLEKQVTYNEIVQKTGASTATISRVKKCLEYGAGGYEYILEKIKK